MDNWKRLQDFEDAVYHRDFITRGSHFGHFSVPEFASTGMLGDIIAGRCVGLRCLDIGCGILPRPNYMKDGPAFFGIDPFYGEYKRQFPFAQAVGEHLPFLSQSFPSAIVMSALDHAVDPLTMLREVHRVLIPRGILFAWVELRTSARIAAWKASGGTFDDYHQWAFSRSIMNELLVSAGFKLRSMRQIPGGVKYPATQLFEAVRG